MDDQEYLNWLDELVDRDPIRLRDEAYKLHKALGESQARIAYLERAVHKQKYYPNY